MEAATGSVAFGPDHTDPNLVGVSGVVEDPTEQFQRGLFVGTLLDDEKLGVHCLAVPPRHEVLRAGAGGMSSSVPT